MALILPLVSNVFIMPSLHIIYASTSGHTEYVIDVLREHIENPKSEIRSTKPFDEAQDRQIRNRKIQMTKTRAEQASANDFTQGDVLVLASGTWNTGGEEGQLNPHMDEFLKKRVKDMDLKGKKVAVIGLGDERYRYTCKAADRLEQWVKEHGGSLLCETLRIANEPYGQEEKIEEWGKQLLRFFTS